MTLENPKFTPTCNKSGEVRKAHYKNLNLAVLQHWYMGNPHTELRCLLTGSPGWVDVPNIVTGDTSLRFRLDFNHIRQQNRFLLGLTKTKSPGMSVDKTRDPSAIFRSTDLAKADRRMQLLEFMCCMPVSMEYHKYVTQDSSLHHVCLADFPAASWPWGLQSQGNFEEFQSHYWGSVLINYADFVTMLHDPLAAPFYTQFPI